MASATTSILLGGRFVSAASTKAAGASMVISLGSFCTASPYSTGSDVSLADSVNKKVTLPTARVAIAYVEVNGQRLPCYIDERSWWAYFNDVDQRRLGGQTAPTIPDLETNVVATKEQAVAATATAANVSTQVNANAQALEAAKQVIVNEGLPGATAIPRVQLTSDFIEP